MMAYAAALGETHARYYDTTAPEGVLAHALFQGCSVCPLAERVRLLRALRPVFPRLRDGLHDLGIERPPRAGETLRVSARIAGVSQRRPGAFVVFRFEARDAAGELVTVTNFGALYRDVPVESAQGEGMEDPPSSGVEMKPVGTSPVSPTAAHVYTECARIWNPIHTDIAYARAAGLPGLILHGTATLALSVSRTLHGVDPAKVRRVRCRFAGMVPMPSTLTVLAAREAQEIAFETRNERGEAVISRGSVTLGA
jgi:acyl dehydratase